MLICVRYINKLMSFSWLSSSTIDREAHTNLQGTILVGKFVKESFLRDWMTTQSDTRGMDIWLAIS